MSYITASDSGTQAVKFVDTRTSVVESATKAGGMARVSSADHVTVYDYGNPVFTALYTDFATPSGAGSSAQAVVDALNAAPYFLNSGGGDLPSNVVIVESDSGLPATLVAGVSYLVSGEVTINKNVSPPATGASSIYGNNKIEDELIFSGGFGFTGTGGIIEFHDIGLTQPNSGQLFNATGQFEFYNCQFRNNVSIGTITTGASSNCIFRDCRFTLNAGGLTVDGNLDISDTEFINTNGGTFLTSTGSPQGISIVNTKFYVPALATGWAQSVDPSVSGQVKDCVFVNLGGTIKTGTFGNIWQVDSIGLTVETDDVATGEIIWSSPAPTTITTQNAWVKCLGTTQAINLIRFDDDSGADNRLKCLTTKDIKRRFTAAISFTSSSNSKTYEFTFAKNGTVTATDELSASRRKVGAASDVGNVVVLGDFSLQQNEYVELFTRCIDASVGSPTIELGNYFT